MKAILRWCLASMFAGLIAGCGGGNGGNATSRNQSPLPANSLTITVNSLPAANTGQAYSQSLSASGGTAPYTWSIASGTLPTGLTLNSAGVISGIPVSACASTVTFKVVDASTPQHEAHQPLTVTVTGNGGLLTIITGSLSPATMGTAYNQALAASGGQAPYTWSIASGTLPPGLDMSSTGVISGTPGSTGAFTVSYKVADSSTPQGEAQRSLTLTVTAGGGPLVVLTNSLPAATVGASYNQNLIASGGMPPYAWSIMGGALPPGLALNSAGAITGTPTTAGTYNILFMVTDANPVQPMVHQPLSITVN